MMGDAQRKKIMTNKKIYNREAYLGLYEYSKQWVIDCKNNNQKRKEAKNELLYLLNINQKTTLTTHATENYIAALDKVKNKKERWEIHKYYCGLVCHMQENKDKNITDHINDHIDWPEKYPEIFCFIRNKDKTGTDVVFLPSLFRGEFFHYYHLPNENRNKSKMLIDVRVGLDLSPTKCGIGIVSVASGEPVYACQMIGGNYYSQMIGICKNNNFSIKEIIVESAWKEKDVDGASQKQINIIKYNANKDKIIVKEINCMNARQALAEKTKTPIERKIKRGVAKYFLSNYFDIFQFHFGKFGLDEEALGDISDALCLAYIVFDNPTTTASAIS